MRFIDIQAIHRASAAKIEAAIARVMEHGMFINGPEVGELEASLARFVGRPHCVAVASGTMALEIALRALEIGPGDEVITTPFTWISTAETIALVGATPVFADIDPDSFNLDPDCVEKAVSPKTKAVIAVNLFGQMADYGRIEAICAAHDLKLIEDAAQSLGAEREGRPSGSVGAVSCTSFFPAKPLGGYGDGGAIFITDPDLATRARAIVNHGGLEREHHTLLGTNGRCDTLQAAIILAKLEAFREQEIALRRELGRRYTEALRNVCATPIVMPGNTHVYAQYTLRSKDRDRLGEALKAEGIPSAVYYRKCLHTQPVFKDIARVRGELPAAEAVSREVISLPFHPYLAESDQDRIIEAVVAHEKGA